MVITIINFCLPILLSIVIFIIRGFSLTFLIFMCFLLAHALRYFFKIPTYLLPSAIHHARSRGLSWAPYGPMAVVNMLPLYFSTIYHTAFISVEIASVSVSQSMNILES